MFGPRRNVAKTTASIIIANRFECAKSGSCLDNEIQKSVTADDVARAVAGTLTSAGAAVVTDVTHDSRQAKAGSLFAAVRGELFDAHKFIPQVMQQGAIGVISESARPDGFNGAWIQ